MASVRTRCMQANIVHRSAQTVATLLPSLTLAIITELLSTKHSLALVTLVNVVTLLAQIARIHHAFALTSRQARNPKPELAFLTGRRLDALILRRFPRPARLGTLDRRAWLLANTLVATQRKGLGSVVGASTRTRGGGRGEREFATARK